MFLHCPQSHNLNHEKSVFETRSVANVKAISNFDHDLTIPKEKYAAAFLRPADFHLIVIA